MSVDCNHEQNKLIVKDENNKCIQIIIEDSEEQPAEKGHFLEYVKCAIFLVLFNVSCIAFLLCVFGFFSFDPKSSDLLVKGVAGFIVIVMLVSYGKLGDCSKGHPNFYYI